MDKQKYELSVTYVEYNFSPCIIHENDRERKL
jgi:hypothetical protein